ncbi:hypothetical protein SDC9_185000 [bioreactor metagenome]|uniref:Uncharacterized protein n=1 Tax=bioreactor metagenome TaxID=1076179 RepID=A0A645HEN5_9ZZZZ
MVNGYTGWINRNVASNEYDMIIVPINQVKNPSYYKSENGLLKHYISSNLKASTEEENGSMITIGVAPVYMKSGVKYLSYDGNYFYDGTNLENALNNLIDDLQAENRNNSINFNNPYYNYYNYLPFRSKTSYSAVDLEKFISENTDSISKLRGISTTLINSESKYGVNALLSLGIAINESRWGLSKILTYGQ